MNDYQHGARSSSSSYVFHRKLAIIGDRHVGKSSLAEQFVSGRFIENYDPTIENTLRKSIGFRGQCDHYFEAAIFNFHASESTF